MRHALSRRMSEVLAQLASKRALLAFDFDGTLAPIVADRDRAVMRSETQRLLASLCELYPCAVISGRSRADVAQRLGMLPVKHVVGNHGIEPGEELSPYAEQVSEVRSILARALSPLRGVEIEDKRYSLAIHYRRATRRAEARAAIDRAVAALPRPMRVIPGKLVANILPTGARNKGEILVQLREQETAEVALYVGDDVTDEDVFELEHSERLVSLRVGRTRRTAALYYLRDQGEIDQLLRWMVDVRKTGVRQPELASSMQNRSP